MIKQNGDTNRMLIQLITMAMMVLFFMMVTLTSCASNSKQTSWPIDKAKNAARFEVPDHGGIPDGWRQYGNELSISCVLPGDMVLAGGVDGLYRLDPTNGSYQPILNNGTPYRMVRSLIQDKNGNIWIGHEFGVDVLRNGSDTTSAGFVEWDSKPVGQVYDLIESDDGAIWAGTMKGAFRINELDVKQFTTEDGLLHNMVNVMVQDSRGDMWFGAYIANGGGLTCLQIEEGTLNVLRKWTFNHSNGLPEDYITTIMEDSRQNVWAGMGVYTAGGAVKFTFNGSDWVAKESLFIENGLAGEKVRFIMEDEKGYQWFCSEYDGIAIFDPNMQRVGVLTIDEGLTDNEVKEITTGDGGDIWLAARRGIVFIPRTWLENVLWK